MRGITRGLVSIGVAAAVVGGATAAFAAEVVVESTRLTHEHRTMISKAGIEVLGEIRTARAAIAERNVGMARRHAARAQSLVEAAAKVNYLEIDLPLNEMDHALSRAFFALQHRDLGSADTYLRAAQDQVRIVIARAAVDVEKSEIVIKGGR